MREFGSPFQSVICTPHHHYHAPIRAWLRDILYTINLLIRSEARTKVYLRIVLDARMEDGKCADTVFPRLETAVTKHFSSIVPRFQFEGQLLYEGRLLIFQHCIAVALLHNICTHAVLFTRTRFRLKCKLIITNARFVYTKTVKRARKRMKTFSLRNAIQMQTFEKVNYRVNTTKTGVKTQQKFAFFPRSVSV